MPTFLFRRFALETVFMEPATVNMRKVGDDLDSAVSSGLADIFQDAKKLFCTQHLQKADERKLKALGANQSSTKAIMADIYGARSGPVEQLGLADAEDTFDLMPNCLAWSWYGTQ